MTKKITFNELVAEYYTENVLPNIYDVFPRNVKYTAEQWQDILKTYETVKVHKLRGWRFIRNVSPELIAKDLVKVQPMQNPTETIFYGNIKFN